MAGRTASFEGQQRLLHNTGVALAFQPTHKPQAKTAKPWQRKVSMSTNEPDYCEDVSLPAQLFTNSIHPHKHNTPIHKLQGIHEFMAAIQD